MATSIFEVADDGKIERYTGNYSDYAEKRPSVQPTQDKCQPSKSEKTLKEDTTRSQRPQKLKLSFKEQQELKTIDDEIAALETQISECSRMLSEAGSDYIRLQALTEKMDMLQDELEFKTQRWFYLNEILEKINHCSANPEGTVG